MTSKRMSDGWFCLLARDSILEALGGERGAWSGNSNENQGGHVLDLLAQWYEQNYKNNSIPIINFVILHYPPSFHSWHAVPVVPHPW